MSAVQPVAIACPATGCPERAVYGEPIRLVEHLDLVHGMAPEVAFKEAKKAFGLDDAAQICRTAISLERAMPGERAKMLERAKESERRAIAAERTKGGERRATMDERTKGGERPRPTCHYCKRVDGTHSKGCKRKDRAMLDVRATHHVRPAKAIVRTRRVERGRPVGYLVGLIRRKQAAIARLQGQLDAVLAMLHKPHEESVPNLGSAPWSVPQLGSAPKKRRVLPGGQK